MKEFTKAIYKIAQKEWAEYSSGLYYENSLKSLREEYLERMTEDNWYRMCEQLVLVGPFNGCKSFYKLVKEKRGW